MKIGIRTDASLQIGTGHFMRCLTLASALQKSGADICFFSRKLPVHLREMLQAEAMESVMLDSDAGTFGVDELRHASWLGASQELDAQATIKAGSGQIWDWLIVDHYALDSRWESRLRPHAKRILAIDDIADRQHHCDVLLDQNLYADMDSRYSGKVPAQCRQLLGPHYALLRDEFRELHAQALARAGTVTRILVFFGGADADNFTGRAIEALSGLGLVEVQVDVVIGAQHPCREQIMSACGLLGYACHVQTDRMAELMAAADLALGAGGAASWERCCLGLPALLVALADNQTEIAKALDSLGACKYLGTLKTVDTATMRTAIIELLGAPDRLSALSRKAYSLVDGLGVERVCQEMSC